ncbi:hypothetical protein [Actinoplanes sp. NPDC049599]|uniref:hypothetical protein n=1 Tax=Actinoplanes sp. NPDC049599 TaxID=3363903 RepID=UPI003795C4D8
MSEPAARALAHVRGLGAAGELPVPRARITVSFHPDRLLADGRSVAAVRQLLFGAAGRGEPAGHVQPR